MMVQNGHFPLLVLCELLEKNVFWKPFSETSSSLLYNSFPHLSGFKINEVKKSPNGGENKLFAPKSRTNVFVFVFFIRML